MLVWSLATTTSSSATCRERCCCFWRCRTLFGLSTNRWEVRHLSAWRRSLNTLLEASMSSRLRYRLSGAATTMFSFPFSFPSSASAFGSSRSIFDHTRHQRLSNKWSYCLVQWTRNEHKRQTDCSRVLLITYFIVIKGLAFGFRLHVNVFVCIRDVAFEYVGAISEFKYIYVWWVCRNESPMDTVRVWPKEESRLRGDFLAISTSSNRLVLFPGIKMEKGKIGDVKNAFQRTKRTVTKLRRATCAEAKQRDQRYQAVEQGLIQHDRQHMKRAAGDHTVGWSPVHSLPLVYMYGSPAAFFIRWTPSLPDCWVPLILCIAQHRSVAVFYTLERVLHVTDFVPFPSWCQDIRESVGWQRYREKVSS